VWCAQALVGAYVAAHASAYAGAAQSRKQAQQLFEKQFATVHDNFQLFLKGALAVEEAGCRGQLEQHLLREHGTDLLALLLANQAMHSGISITGGGAASLQRSSSDPSVLAIPQELRAAGGRRQLLDRLPAAHAEPLLALEATLGGKQADSFARRLGAAAEACELRLSAAALDKKKEKQVRARGGAGRRRRRAPRVRLCRE
jgi:hypothetical protein